MAFQCTSFMPANHAETVWRWKKLLVEQCNWVLKASSDGLTFDTTGAVDKIATGYGTGAGNTNNPQCWFVVEQPSAVAGKKRQLLFEKKNTTDPSFWRIAYSLAGFTYGAASATVAPTATDVREANDATGVGTTYVAFALFQGTGFASRILIGADDAAPSGMWAINLSQTSPFSSSSAGGWFLFDPLASGSYTGATGNNGDSGDLDPYVIAATSSATLNSECFDYSKWVLDNGKLKGWLRYGATVGTPIMQSYKLQSVLTHSGYGTFPALPVDPYVQKDPTLPVWYMNDAAALPTNRHVKGVSSLLRLNLTARATGDTLSTASTRDRIVLGDFSVPWNGTVPVL